MPTNRPSLPKTGPAPRDIERIVEVRRAHPRLLLSVKEVSLAIATLDANASHFRGGCPPGELSLVFMTDPILAKVHADFMNDPTTTDVITFEGNPQVGVAGEICVSVDTAAYAKLNKREFAKELMLYIVHGWLHLAGYSDLKPTQKRLMRAAEKRALRLLQQAEAMPAFRLA